MKTIRKWLRIDIRAENDEDAIEQLEDLLTTDDYPIEDFRIDEGCREIKEKS